MSAGILNEQQDLDSPYNPNPHHIPDLESTGIYEDPEGNHGEIVHVGRRKTLWKRIKHTILNRGYVPLVLRLISFLFSVAALFIAAFITRFSVLGGIDTRPSTGMAFVVNGIALFYLPWVAKVKIR